MKRMALVLSALSFSVVLGAVGCEGGGEGEGEGEEGEGEEGEGEEGEGEEGEGEEGEGEGEEGEGEGEAPPIHDFCQEECADNDDCTVAGGTDIGLECVNGRCASTAPPPPPCTTDDACTAQSSGWATDCTTNAECLGTNICIDIDEGGTGAGKCAGFVPAAGQCLGGFAVLAVTDINGTAAEVCGNETVCNDDTGFCAPPPCATDDDCADATPLCREDGVCVVCKSNDDCADGDLTACNEVTGTCGCASNEECAGNEAGEFCLVDSGTCGCAGNDDCTDDNRGDVCTDGTCGCNAVEDCNGTRGFDGTTYVCEGI